MYQIFSSIYRNLAFTAFGCYNFSASAFESAARHKFRPGALERADLRGKVMLITGANSGLGREVAEEFFLRGGTVYMVCRSAERGRRALEEIQEQKPGSSGSLYLVVADVSKPRSLSDMAKKFSADGLKFDILVNNAGILPSKKALTSDGFEETFATNTLGTYFMTRLFLPLMKRDPNCKSRIINVSSGGMYTERLNSADPQLSDLPFDGMRSYSQTKRQQVVMTQWFAQTDQTVFFASCHPGWAETEGVRSSIPDFFRMFRSLFRTAKQGADTILWLSISPDVDLHTSGSFYHDRSIAREHLPLAGTQESEKEISEFMEKLQNIYNVVSKDF